MLPLMPMQLALKANARMPLRLTPLLLQVSGIPALRELFVPSPRGVHQGPCSFPEYEYEHECEDECEYDDEYEDEYEYGYEYDYEY